MNMIANFLAQYKVVFVATFLLGGVLLVAKGLMDDRRDVVFTEK